MNLTKGKISKLHNKKKQSVKKYKKRAKTHKTKTLRRKHKSVNLVKSTLKNYKVWFGGDGEGGDAIASPIDNAPASPIEKNVDTSPISLTDASISPIDNAIPNTSTDNIDTDVSVDIPEESPMDIGAGDVPDAEDIPSATSATAASDITEESPMDIGAGDVPDAEDNTPELISQENTTALEESNPIIDEPLEIEAAAPATTPSLVTEIEAPTPVQVEEIAPTPVPVQPQEQISADDLALLRAIKAIVNQAVQQPQPLVDENAASNIAGTALTFANA